MKIKNLSRGLVGGVIALALVTTTLPAPVHARTVTLAQLQAQIQTLITQISMLQAQLQAQRGGGLVCAVPQSNLTFGDRGPDVTSLQTFLINHGHPIPAGATGYFGPQTQHVLRQFQAVSGISPALGYNYGPLTRAQVQARCTITPAPQPDPDPDPDPDPNPSLRGEASLERFSVKDGTDTDLEENDRNAEIMEISFRVENGDARFNRLEIGFTPDNANDEDDPWDTFEEVSIWSGNTRLARVDATDKDNWRENSPTNDDYTIRLSGIDWILPEGSEIELTVHVDIQNGVRGTANGEIWTAFIPDDGLRAIDADNVALHIGDAADAVTLNIDQEGASDELITRRSDQDPDASVLRLERNRNSGYLEVFAFDLDTDDSENDIDIRELPIQITVNNGTLADYARDVRLIVDNETYTDETIIDGTTGIVTFEFDRGEFTIDAGDRITVAVEVRFRALAEADEGTTIVGHVEADDIDAEGGDDLNTDQLQGAATGEVHTMYTRGGEVNTPQASAVVTSIDGSNNDYVTMSLTVQLNAFGHDVYIPIGTNGVAYQLQDALGNTHSASGTPVVTSSARERNGYFHIPEGSTESVTLDVTYQPGVPNTTVRLQLISINFNDVTAPPDQNWIARPASTYRTPTRTVVN